MLHCEHAFGLILSHHQPSTPPPPSPPNVKRKYRRTNPKIAQRRKEKSVPSFTYHRLLVPPLVDVLPLRLSKVIPDFLILMTCSIKNFFNLIDCDNKMMKGFVFFYKLIHKTIFVLSCFECQ